MLDNVLSSVMLYCIFKTIGCNDQSSAIFFLGIVIQGLEDTFILLLLQT